MAPIVRHLTSADIAGKIAWAITVLRKELLYRSNHLGPTGRILHLPHKEAVDQRTEEDRGQHAEARSLGSKVQQDSGI